MSGINRFLSRRDKHGHGTHKERPKHHGGPLNGLFETGHEKRKPEKDEDKRVKAIAYRLSKHGIATFKDSDISFVLNGAYASGDPDKAYELLLLLEDSEEGIIQSYNPYVKLLGAINRQGVTCYLDALLFAMFARLGNFEAMLYKNFDDPPRKKLATLLRLWVNTLRAGKLITTDITEQIQLQLANCGWDEAAELCQQDASEAFTFITSTLALPLLTLKMDIFHWGKEDASDDHKFINERLIELAIPEDPPDGHVITLEECLELFFNNKIEVKRYLERRNTLTSVKSRASVDSTKANASHVEVAEVGDILQSPTSGPQQQASPIPIIPSRPQQRQRASSIFQEQYITDLKAGSLDRMDSIDEKSPQHGRTRKEVMMSAWQFFSLIPWYTDNVPSNDIQVAQHFSSTRPILGICLKRYGMSPNGTAFKRKTFIDIPLEIALPHFIQDDRMAEDGPAFGNFKLSLQSIVCHRGISVESGHYISLVRSPPSDSPGGDVWLRFDDLAKDRVADTNIEQFLREESPYLLFYQVVPIEGDPGNIADGENPPAYSESNTSWDSKVDSGVASLSINAGDSRDSNEPDLARTTFEIRRGSTDTSISDGPRGRSSMQSDRPPSIVFSETGGTGMRPEAFAHADQSFGISQQSGPNALTASRRGSKANQVSSKSRPSSRADDKRTSSSLSRLASRMSRDRMSTLIGMPPSQAGSKEDLPNAAAPSQARDPPNSAVRSPPAAMADGDKPANRSRLKKEAREKSKTAHRDHQHLTKARRKEGKPDRECVVM